MTDTGRTAGYEPPKVHDLGTLEQITKTGTAVGTNENPGKGNQKS